MPDIRKSLHRGVPLFTRSLLVAFLLVILGHGHAFGQTLSCGIIEGQTLVIDGCTDTLAASQGFSGVNIGVTAPGELDLFSNVTLTASNSVNVGLTDPGKLQVLDQAIVNDAYGVVGNQSCGLSCFSLAAVAGQGSQWNNSNELSVGSSGAGSLSIQAGGQVTDTVGTIGGNSGSDGSVIVIDAGSAWINKTSLTVGNGSLTVEDGGGSGSGLPGTVGTLTINGTGRMTVEEPGASWNTTGAIVGGGTGIGASLLVADTATFTDSGAMTVGSSSDGTLTIEKAGRLTDSSATLAGPGSAFPASGKVIVDGAGSQWNNLGTVTVGQMGQGTLTVKKGGSGNSTTLTIGGVDIGSSMTLTDPGSSWNASSVLVGGGTGTTSLTVTNSADLADTGKLQVGANSSNATMTISAGARVTDTTGLVAGNSDRSSGSVTVDGAGSQWTNSGTLTIGNHGSLTISQGGTVTSSGQVVIGNGTGGTGAVIVSESQWDPTSLAVGNAGAGSLTAFHNSFVSAPGGIAVGLSGGTGSVAIAGESELSTSSLCVGCSGGGSGSLTVVESGLSASSLCVGCSGSGTIAVESGATGSTTGSVDIGEQAGSTGAMTLFHVGMWESSGSVVVGDQGEGELSVEDYSSFTSQTLTIGREGSGSMTLVAGGSVSDEAGYVGEQLGSVGTVLVTEGSEWQNSTSVAIGIYGTGKLTVNTGGIVAAGTLQNPGTITIGSQGTVGVDGGKLQGIVIHQAGVLYSTGTITIQGTYTQDVDGTLILDAAGTGAGDFGQLDVSGNATFGGTIKFDFIDGFAPSKGDSFDFINLGGSADFSGATIDIAGLLPGFNYTDSFQNGQFTLTALNNGMASSPTPEPGTLLLFGTALLGLLALRRRLRSICSL